MKKSCAGCGKQIPEAALHCVFCGAKQDTGPDEASATGQVGGEEHPESTEPQAAASSRAGVTQLGLRAVSLNAEDDAAEDAASTSGAVPNAPISLDATPVRGLPVLGELPRRSEPVVRPPVPFVWPARLLLALSGATLLVLFSLSWHGVTSWQLLETLTGSDYVRQLYLLGGGVVLLATALLPVPVYFRAVIGATVGAVPLVLKFQSMLTGWHGVVAGLAIILLPATHLLRAPRGASFDRLGRLLVVLSAVAVALVYVVPISSVMPVVYVGRMLGSLSVSHTVVGLFVGIPLLLAVLSLLGALGRDLASVAVLLSLLILLWPPAAVLIFFADSTQYYVSIAILLTSTTAAVCAAQALSYLGSRPRA